MPRRNLDDLINFIYVSKLIAKPHFAKQNIMKNKIQMKESRKIQMTEKEKITENKIIAIDHGNRMIKTENYSFNASYIESSYLPSLTNEVVDFEGKTYTLAEQSNVVLNDKTVDERYFILSLFAIAKELIRDENTEQHFGGWKQFR